MNINTEIWGQGFANFEGFNVRTGATDLTDPDYEDYPPFYLNNIYPDPPETYHDVNYTLRAGLASEKFERLEPLPDLSIAYVACKDPYYLRVGAFGCTNDAEYQQYAGPGVDWCFHDDISKPKPIVFICDKRLKELKALHSNYTPLSPNLFLNPLYRTSQGVYNNGQYYYCPTSRDGYDDVWSRCNASYDMAYYRSFGIRSIFGVIHVYCYDNTDLAPGNVPKNSINLSLNDYKSRTESWKETHPIIGAYLQVYYRSNTDGTYTAATNNTYPSITVDMTLNMVVDRDNTGYFGDVADIIAPCLNVGDNVSHTQLPLYGCMGTQFKMNMGTNSPDEGGMSSSNYCLFIGAYPSMVMQGEGSPSYERICWVEMDGTLEYNLEFIMKSAACYGLFFTDGDPTETGYAPLFAAGNDNTRWQHEKMCLGVVDSDGCTDGTYTRGSGNTSAPNYEWKDSTQSPYDPSKPPPVDPTQYSEETDFNVIGGVANCNKMYAVNASNIMSLAKALSTAITTRLSDLPPLDYSIETFLTNNPLDCVVSLRKFPVQNLSTGTEQPISFGSYQNANVQGIPFIKSYDKVDFNFSVAARNSLYPHFGDFRDYEPYTHAELIVPFCGTVQINPSDFIGHDINVYMIIDYITGGCTAYIAADKLVVTSISGTVAVDVPLSGIQQATLESQRVNAVMARKSADISLNNAIVGGLSSSIGLLGSAASGNVLGAVGSGAGLLSSVGRIEQADLAYQKADYELKHMQVPFKQVSAGTPIASTVIENKCRLIIYRPILDESYNAEVYAKTIGFACLMNGKVKDFTGLTQGNINVDGLDITETEKQWIKKAFASGVIL